MRLHTSRAFQLAAALAVLVGVSATALPAKADPPRPTVAAAAKYDSAIAAELQGDLATRDKQLRAAVSADPQFAPAHWRLGEIEAAERWQTVEATTAQLAQDTKLADYRRQRDAARDTLAGNLALARLATRHGLPEEARVHWTRVLQFSPTHEEAIKALSLRKVGQRWIAPDTFDRGVQQQRDQRAAAERWKPVLSRIERSLTAEEPKRSAALAELRAIRDPAAIPTLREALSLTDPRQPFRRLDEQSKAVQRNKAKNLDYIGILDQIVHPDSTRALVYEAVLSSDEGIRKAAIAALANRPWPHFVPQLLSGLTAPIDARVTVSVDDQGRVLYRRSYFREGPLADYSLTYDAVFNGSLITTVIYPDTGEVRTREIDAPVSSGAVRSIRTTAASAKTEVDRINDSIGRRNARIQAALQGATNVELAAEPGLWWRWWQDYNELHIPDEKPIYERVFSDYYSSPTYDNNLNYSIYQGAPAALSGLYAASYSRSPCCCFTAGTIVQTKTGPAAIESIHIGDFVLAQNAATGELAFKPVVSRTTRPAAPLVAMQCGSDNLLMTRGHPLWVVGRNWQMAKQLNVGDRLCTVGGVATVSALNEAKPEPTYNLVVADFHNFFVGQQRVLVHDNTPPQPTTAKLPGVQ